jgi:CheY-like chemotaxis protein
MILHNVIDGFEATRCIREQARFAKTPIIALTAGDNSKERERSLSCGMNDFVSKPIKPEELIATLAQWIIKTEQL